MRMPLEGIRIADLTAYIAGSYMASMCSDMGADVVKVEGFDGDGFRPNAASFIGWNRNKRAIVVNLRDPDGREVFYDMVRRSDVVTENARPGMTARNGVDYESIRKIKPDIVYVSLPGWGTRGPHAVSPGWDPLLQAYSGHMALQGGYKGTPVFHRVAITDYQSGELGTLAVVLGVFHKRRTGQGQLIQSGLLNAGIYHDVGYFLDYEGRPSSAEVGGDRHKGEHPALRLYKAKDEWFLVACYYDEHWKTLCDIIGRPDLAQQYSFKEIKAKTARDYEIVGAIQAELLTRPAREWVELMTAAGVPCAPGHEHLDMFADPQVQALGLVVKGPHPRRGEVEQLGPVVRFSLTPEQHRYYAPMHGEYTVEVMKELGYSQEKIDDLLARNVAGQQGLNLINQL